MLIPFSLSFVLKIPVFRFSVDLVAVFLMEFLFYSFLDVTKSDA